MMKNSCLPSVRSILFILLALTCFHNVEGYCKKKTLFGKIKFSCPEPGQPSDYLACCGDDDDIGGQFCCRPGAYINDRVFMSIGSVVGTIAGILGFMLVLLVICCCICPCCLLYKRRNSAGNVYRSTVQNPSVNATVIPAPNANSGPPPVGFASQNQAPGYPMQQSYGAQPGYPVQPGYPTQQGYPPQTGYPPQQPQQGYPPQPQPGYPMPPQQPYPGQPQPPNYYTDQPPPYSGVQESFQKQPAYNPNY